MTLVLDQGPQNLNHSAGFPCIQIRRGTAIISGLCKKHQGVRVSYSLSSSAHFPVILAIGCSRKRYRARKGPNGPRWVWSMAMRRRQATNKYATPPSMAFPALWGSLLPNTRGNWHAFWAPTSSRHHWWSEFWTGLIVSRWMGQDGSRVGCVSTFHRTCDRRYGSKGVIWNG